MRGSSFQCQVSSFQFRSSISLALLAAVMLAGTARGQYLATGGDLQKVYTNLIEGKIYAAHIFTSTSGGTFTPTGDPLNCDYLVVAGGGSGGTTSGAGNGINGTGSGGGGCAIGTSGRGGNGIVVIRYEILPVGTLFMLR